MTTIASIAPVPTVAKTNSAAAAAPRAQQTLTRFERELDNVVGFSAGLHHSWGEPPTSTPATGQ